MNNKNIVACFHCDLLILIDHELSPDEIIKCPRCDNTVISYVSEPRDIFILAITSLILLISTLMIPALNFQMGNLNGEFSVLETAFAMFNNEQLMIGILIFISIISAPIIYFFSILWLVTPIYLFHKKAKSSKFFIKLINLSRDWIMLEVFFVSLLIAMIKLSDNMSLDINFAFVPMISLIVITAVLHKIFDIYIYFEWLKKLNDLKK